MSNHHKHLGKDSQRFSKSVEFFVTGTSFAQFPNTGPTVCNDLTPESDLNTWFLQFPARGFFCYAEHSVHGFVCLGEIHCTLDTNIRSSALSNIFDFQLRHEVCIEAVRVLVDELDCVQILLLHFIGSSNYEKISAIGGKERLVVVVDDAALLTHNVFFACGKIEKNIFREI